MLAYSLGRETHKNKYALFYNYDKIEGGEQAIKTKAELPAYPVATAVALIGGKWKLLILLNLKARPWRFNELQRDLDGISQKVLTDSLRQMMERDTGREIAELSIVKGRWMAKTALGNISTSDFGPKRPCAVPRSTLHAHWECRIAGSCVSAHAPISPTGASSDPPNFLTGWVANCCRPRTPVAWN